MNPVAGPAVVLQIVPGGEGGVRDAADALAGAWQAGGTLSPRLALTAASTASQPLHVQVPALLRALRDPATGASCSVDGVLPLLVHFSGYGYHPRGLCGWLPQQLVLLRRTRRVRITVYFHELHAGGMPWQSAFWLHSAQARAARAMLAQADAWWTNAQQHASWLRQQPQTSPAAAQAVWPVFSNVGEHHGPQQAATRPREMLVFGSQASRQRAAKALKEQGAALKALAVSGLVEAGTGMTMLAPVVDLPVRFVGTLHSAQIGALLRQCRFGAIDYPSALLAKSSVFAAYAAHGCVALNTRREAAPAAADGLLAGTHYLAASASRTAFNDEHLHRIARTAAAWYAPHALHHQAVELLRLVAPGA